MFINMKLSKHFKLFGFFQFKIEILIKSLTHDWITLHDKYLYQLSKKRNFKIITINKVI